MHAAGQSRTYHRSSKKPQQQQQPQQQPQQQQQQQQSAWDMQQEEAELFSQAGMIEEDLQAYAALVHQLKAHSPVRSRCELNLCACF